MIHYDSPDRRGIDVALIYNEKTVNCLFSKSHRVSRKGLNTRDILYMKALMGIDTCHFFVNHWPSRSSGQLETENDRYAAAQLLKRLTDSIHAINPAAKILIMGDFNDEPRDKSLAENLNAQINWTDTLPKVLYNLSGKIPPGPVKGTLKYQGEWNTFDQIIVSGSLLSNSRGISVNECGFRILTNQFLFEPDNTYLGYKPFRTYAGFTYKGGFSDHLPVYVDLVSKSRP
jgi:endonuclease/exonuclease/phosphatase family metal-dependent hydrolase